MTQRASLLAVAVDLGGTQVRAALVDQTGAVLRRAAMATAAQGGPAAVTGQIAEAAAKVSQGVERARIVGLGICSPGPIDTERGVALGIPTLKGFEDAPLKAMIGEATGLGVAIENDGIAAALGEWRFGAGRGLSNLVYVTVSTGIGGGVVMDGRLAHGRKGLSAHIGHMTIVRDGELCACGNLGCWEAYANGAAFSRRAGPGADGAPRTVFAAAEAGDARALDLVAQEADWLGVGIANLLHLYSPEAVIVGGGLSNGLALMAPGIEARIRRAAMAPFRDIPVLRAALGDNSGLVGAAALAFDARAKGNHQ